MKKRMPPPVQIFSTMSYDDSVVGLNNIASIGKVMIIAVVMLDVVLVTIVDITIPVPVSRVLSFH